MTTYGSCCYTDCPNSYPTHAVFFKFPSDDTKPERQRRQAWIEHSGNPELEKLSDRQLRAKKVCARHFLQNSFANPTTLTSTAIPVVYKASDSPKKAAPPAEDASENEQEAEDEPPPPQEPAAPPKKRGRKPSIAPSTPAPAAVTAAAASSASEEEEEDENPAAETPTPAKRGRGRPPRVKTEPSTPAAASASTPKPVASASAAVSEGEKRSMRVRVIKTEPEEEPPIKKAKAPGTPAAPLPKTPGPGRPPKTPATATSTAEKKSKDKSDAEDEVSDVEKPVSRGRGRPPSSAKGAGVKDKPTPRPRVSKNVSESEEEYTPKKARAVAASAANAAGSKSPGRPSTSKSPLTFTAAEVRSASKKAKSSESDDEMAAIEKEVAEMTSGTNSAKDRTPAATAKKEIRSIERLFTELKAQCALAEQWTLNGVFWDAARSMKLISATEIDVTNFGAMRVKRCVQIYEDLSIKIFIDDMNMTGSFDVTKVTGAAEVSLVIAKVAMAKICPGIKTFESNDSNFFPSAIKRGGNWYSADCPIIVDSALQGPLCTTCARLRSSVRRRKIREKIDLEKKQSKLLVKVQSKFGKALYSLLTELMTEDTMGVRKPPLNRVPTSQPTSASGMFANAEMDQFKEPGELQDVKGGIPLLIPKGGNISSAPGKKIRAKAGSDDTPKQKGRSSAGRAPRGKNSAAAASNAANSLAAAEGQNDGHVDMMEQYVTIEGENGDIILQPSAGAFTLAEGQEYELIGEADPNDPMQMIEGEQNPHQTIEIIEVDDHTMALMTGRSVNDMFFQGSENIQVTEIDPNDPNMGQLLKVIDPSQGYTFQ